MGTLRRKWINSTWCSHLILWCKSSCVPKSLKESVWNMSGFFFLVDVWRMHPIPRHIVRCCWDCAKEHEGKYFRFNTLFHLTLYMTLMYSTGKTPVSQGYIVCNSIQWYSGKSKTKSMNKRSEVVRGQRWRREKSAMAVRGNFRNWAWKPFGNLIMVAWWLYAFGKLT